MQNLFVIVTNPPLSQGFYDCALLVYPDGAEVLKSFSVNPHATQEQNLTGLSSIIPIHTPVLLLTDVFGSTSSNICLKLVHSLGCEMVVGVNLPMILRGLCYRHEPMQTLLPRVIQAGTNSIFSIEHGATRNM